MYGWRLGNVMNGLLLRMFARPKYNGYLDLLNSVTILCINVLEVDLDAGKTVIYNERQAFFSSWLI